MVSRNISLAQQVAAEVLSGITEGGLVSQDGLLPSESELSLHFKVSRATIREALSKLEQRGVIIRRHGVGTFVAARQPRVEAGLEELESLLTLAQRIGLETHVTDCVIEERQATADEARRLGLGDGEEVLAVDRVMATGKQPIAYLVDVVRREFLSREDLGESFNGSVLDIFRGKREPQLKHSYTEIMAEAADAAVARKLHLQRGAPLLKFQAQLVGMDDRVIDCSLSYFVPGYFRFHIIRRVNQLTF